MTEQMSTASELKSPSASEAPHKTGRANLRWIIVPVVLALGYLGVGFYMLHPTEAGCDQAQADITHIQNLISQGQTADAAGLADLTLAQGNTCGDVKPVLANLEYRASMQDIYDQPTLDGQTAYNRWQLAEDRAISYGIALDPPMTVADDAYHAGSWDFARLAFQKGWQQDQDPSNIPLYYDIMRNWGDQLLRSDQAQDRDDGAHMLSTACAIATTYNLAQQQACAELDAATGSDPADRPAPLSNDPVLAPGQ